MDRSKGPLTGIRVLELGSMRGIAMIVGPAFFSLLFAAVSARGDYPLVGAPWFCGALLLVLAAILAQRALRAEPSLTEAR